MYEEKGGTVADETGMGQPEGKPEQLGSRAREEAEDILVLPELWDTGFFPSENLDSLADVDGCKAKNFLSEMARRYRVNIVGGSVLVKEGSCY